MTIPGTARLAILARLALVLVPAGFGTSGSVAPHGTTPAGVALFVDDHQAASATATAVLDHGPETRDATGFAAWMQAAIDTHGGS